jgi:hypothetical protein
VLEKIENYLGSGANFVYVQAPLEAKKNTVFF